MPASLTPQLIRSISEFQQQAADWDDLWHDSAALQLLSQSGGIALWMNHFATDANFNAIVVTNAHGQLVGGLAFIISQRFGVTQATLPANEWANAGELLIRSGASTDDVAKAILSGLNDAGIQWIRFEGISLDAPQWIAFSNAIKNQSGDPVISRVKQVGLIDIGHDWDAYFTALSSNHRSAVRRSEKKARKSGQLELVRINDFSEIQIRDWMKTAFEIEHRSWKGEQGSSILACEGMADYFVQEAIFANSIDALELWFLMLDNQPIAFEYCHNANQTCFSYKIGYDESFKQLGPGRLLRKLQLELLSQDAGHRKTRTLDTMGILCHAKAKWATRDYRTGMLSASLSGLYPTGLFKLGSLARDIKQRLKPNSQQDEKFKLGGAGFQIAPQLPTETRTPVHAVAYDEI